MGFNRHLLPDPSFYYPDHVEGLKQSGKRWKALCPFHNERTPSFFINPETGAYKCFGCNVGGGDVLQFHREKYDMGFKDAAEALGAWE